MKADITRDTFNPLKHFSRVLMQQGRVQLDADWNEQTAILLHYLRNLGADLIGPHGGPADIIDGTSKKLLQVNCGFEIITDKTRIDALPADTNPSALANLLKNAIPPILVGKGHYYVDGVLCKNEEYIAYSAQTGYPFTGETKFEDTKSYLFYLDVWERHVTYVEDEDKNRDNPGIREVALGGPDTATRAEVVWQIKVTPPFDATPPDFKANYNAFLKVLDEIAQPGTGQLKARAKKPTGTENDPCAVSSEARYRGTENQLYRVEVHKPGVAWLGKLVEGKPDSNFADAATFKWSRENGSVVFLIQTPVATANGMTTVTLENLGRDPLRTLEEGDWVEIVDDVYMLQGRAEPLLQIGSIDRDNCVVTLKGATASEVGQDTSKHPLLRRWDHKGGDSNNNGLTIQEGAALIREGSTDDGWLILENGVQIQFVRQTPQARYRTGDYWLMPARVVTGDVEWPGPADAPEARPPHGVQHHYAPLWIVTGGTGGAVTAANDCRRTFTQIAT